MGHAAQVMLARALVQLVAPPLCAGCGATAGAGLEPMCARCRRELRWLGPEPVQLSPAPDPLERPGPAARGPGLAAAPPPGAAAASPPGLAAGFAPGPAAGFATPPTLLAWAPLAYEGPAQGVVRALKFRGAHRAAGAMAAQIVANAPPGWLEDATTALVPAPLHPRRARTRGYNQARLLADAIAARTGLSVHDCLVRSGPSRTQVGRDRAQRLGGIAGSVQLAVGRSPPPARALLVDDVITTGATLAACAAVLGATQAIAYARTPGR